MGAVQGYWWHQSWIPFASLAQYMYCVDTAPSDTGTDDQIITYEHQDASRYHLGHSQTDFLGEYQRGIESEKYVLIEWDEQYLFIEPKYGKTVGHPSIGRNAL